MYEFVNDKQLSAFAKALALIFAVAVGGAVIMQSKAEDKKMKDIQEKSETVIVKKQAGMKP